MTATGVPWLIAFGLALALSASVSSADFEEPSDREVSIKAAFLYRVLDFAVWPESDSEEFVLAIVDGGPYPEILQKVVGKEIAGRLLTLRTFDKEPSSSELDGIDALFLPGVREPSTELLEALGNAPVLLVGEGREFARRGGAIALVKTQKSTVGFVVNPAVPRRTGIHLRAQLLRLAEEIFEDEGVTVE